MPAGQVQQCAGLVAVDGTGVAVGVAVLGIGETVVVGATVPSSSVLIVRMKPSYGIAA